MTAISGVEFLIWLLIAASTIAVLTKYLRIPYTVALVLGIAPEPASSAVAVAASTESAAELANTRCNPDSVSPFPCLRGQRQD